jgi:hypothetical protein
VRQVSPGRECGRGRSHQLSMLVATGGAWDKAWLSKLCSWCSGERCVKRRGSGGDVV